MIIGLLLIGLIIALAALTVYTVHLITHPPRRTYASALARGRPGDPSEIPPEHGGARAYESWTFASRGLELPAWEVAGDLRAGPTFIFTHGWGDSRIGALSRVPAVLPFASRVIAWDMPGHGDAPGTSTIGAHEPQDLLALIERVNPTTPLILFGWSMGAGISIVAAAKSSRAVAAVIAESPHRLPATGARNMLISQQLPHRPNLAIALAFLGARWGAAWNRPEVFDRAVWASKLACPLLVLHGAEDAISPLGDGRSIAEGARGGRFLEVDGAGHAGLWTRTESRALCAQAVAEFVREALGAGPSTIRR